jgi:hypothetical protein
MPNQLSGKPSGSFFTRLTYFLKAVYIFFPGIIFLGAGLFIFLNLPQGKDVIIQSTDGKNSGVTGMYLVLATIFWVMMTWYTARIIAYNREDLYKEAPWVLFHFPRLLGYCIFLVLWLAVFLINDVTHKLNAWAWFIVAVDTVIYIFFYDFIEKSYVTQIDKAKWNRLNLFRNMVRVLIILSCVAIIIGWQYKMVNILLYTLPVFQLGFLFLVIVRHPLYDNRPGREERNKKAKRNFYGEKYLVWAFSGAYKGFDGYFEKPIFIIFNIISFLAFVCYILAINSLPFARELTSFPLVILAFGVLLGFINFIALASYKKNINFNFLLIGLIIICGFIYETHYVRLKKTKDKAELPYFKRPGFRAYLQSWIKWHKAAIDSSDHYAVFFTLADGGASRSGYWAADVLARLHEKTRYSDTSNHSYFLDHLFCLSGASGGSVGNASFLASFKIQQTHPQLGTDSLSMNFLNNDFLSYALARLLGPDIIKPVFGFVHGWGDRAAALELAMDNPSKKDSLMGKMMKADFAVLIPNDENQLPALCINATKVNDGAPAVVSTINFDSSNVKITRKKSIPYGSADTTYIDSSRIFGKRVDVLNLVPAGRIMRISTAMVLGARFPYMSPGGKLGDSYFVDGGYFDNSGAGVVNEMLLELNRIAADSTDPLSKTVRKFQFYVLHLSNTPYADPKQSKKIHPALNDLATPLLTLAGSYNSQTTVNDARLVNYLKELNKERNSYLILNLYRKDTIESIPMNWVISDRARELMRSTIDKKKAVDSIIVRLNRKETIDLFKRLKTDD